ncbi:MAG TPA: SDR family oxidoreductase [Vicinamibacteria bacterium]|nr:SDR family oxidoreductase [Vicinamibacteria bacterium]
MRVLVTGAGGLLGGRLAELLHGRGLEVLAAHRLSIPPPGPRPVLVELTDETALARLLDASRPDAVVHAAAVGQAHHCEERPDEAERVNARLPGILARECHERGLRLVALSTDLVFRGDRAFVREDDPPGPLGVYGRTKLAGEQAVLSACPGAAVARVALVLGRGHGARATSTESVARALLGGQAVRLFTDEYRTPVDPESVAEAVRRLLERPVAGLFHLGGPERISRHDLGRRVARWLGLPEAGIAAGRQADHAGPDRRAADVSLDSGRARSELGWEPRPIDEAIRESRAARGPG